ncbi:hypothetical protein [Falsihalocynthiibacter arcticus]|uniref:Uncharacterized protein n=1 Tax=Falsihalocynthiibacter arcticus TaxID=1579316 RepID=A0A126V061_9RHOB|nr:hypothetical protein [Falsihalocynthiibacter arcticus]AML51711.1 hypothetical protein RC74_10955 [Falsihalocynthiibacter arcticus]
MDFTKPAFKTRFTQLGFLVRHTFTIVGRNRALLGPLIVMWIYAAVMICLSFIGLVLAVYENGNSTWFLLGAAVMFIYKFFFYNRAELTLSRLTYGTATGGTPTQREARNEIAGLKSQIRTLGLLDMAAVWVASRKNKEGGLMAMLLGGIVEVWDLVNHFLLPAFAIDRLSLSGGIAEMKRLKDHVPETLAGVFGIDIMGGVIGSLMKPFYLFGGLAGGALGLLFGGGMPDAFSAGALSEISGDIPQLGPIGPDTVFNWLPVFVVVFVSVLIHALFARAVTAIKVIYFTLFYTRIMHPEDLAPEMRADLEGYLDLDADEMPTASVSA